MEIDFQKRNYFSRRYMFIAGIRMRIKNKNKYKLRMKEQEENSGEKKTTIKCVCEYCVISILFLFYHLTL